MIILAHAVLTAGDLKNLLISAKLIPFEEGEVLDGTILIADDEVQIAELIELYLEKDNVRVIKAENGIEAWNMLEANKVDLAIIDIMMPGMDGYQLIRKIRTKYSIPVIMLSAKTSDSDKILGLDLGADDYIAKPFNPLEVVARVQAQLRRFFRLNPQAGGAGDSRLMKIGDLTLDEDGGAAYKGGQQLPLTQTEFKMLAFLMRNADRVMTKKQIFESVWEAAWYADDGTIMVHISNLRDKIESDSRQPVYLKTIRGLGYKFEKNPESGLE
jgi:DNA-binding response OmpR family regulator